MNATSTPSGRSDFDKVIGAALANGLGAVDWARRDDRWSLVDAESGLIEEYFVLDALVVAVEVLPGVGVVS